MLKPTEEMLPEPSKSGEGTQSGGIPPSSEGLKTPETQVKSPDNSPKSSNLSSEPTTKQTSVTSIKEDHHDEEPERSQEPPATSTKESTNSSEPSSKNPLLPSIETADMEAPCISEDSSKLPELPPRESRLSTRKSSRLQSSAPSVTKEEVTLKSPQPMDSAPASRSLRKRKREPPSEEDLMRPLTQEERRNWPGWAEIESEPALFNYILKGHGVKDVKIKELMGAEDQFLDMLPKPVHGVIFLFKYRDGEDETADLPKCPQNVWFANQVASNSCATVAMLNILMNVPDIDLGPTLSVFKAATINKKPPYRGRDLKNNALIRIVHNSFVRRVEVLNADLYLQNDFEKWQKHMKAEANAAKRRKVTAAPKKKTVKQKKQEEDEAAFHFVAYVPINGEVWRMDGMQRNPVNLGAYKSGSWLTVMCENVSVQMAMHPDDENYNFMAICRAPLSIIRSDLASNAHALQDIEEKLTGINPDWRASLPPPPSPSSSPHHPSSTSHQDNANANANSQSHSHENSPSPSRELSDAYGLTQPMILSSPITPAVFQKMERAGTDMEALMMLRKKLITEENRLQREHCEEVMDDSDEAEKAQMHMVDYGPDMYKVVKELLESGELREIWDDL